LIEANEGVSPQDLIGKEQQKSVEWYTPQATPFCIQNLCADILADWCDNNLALK
jgi:hypothetical protein